MKKILIKLKEIWNKISNTKSLMSIASLVLIITNVLGFELDNERIMTGVKAFLGFLVILGIINDTGMKTSKFNDKD